MKRQVAMSNSSTPVRYRSLFAVFFKIGLFTFGGGYAMLPLMERELVTKHRWVDEKDIMDVFAVAQSFPGPIAVNAATFTGYRLAGRLGAISSTMGCVLPSFLVISIIAAGFSQFQDLPIVQNVFFGIRAAVTAQIFLAALKMSKKAIVDWVSLLIMLITVALILFLDLHPILTVIGGGLAGTALFWLFPAWSRRKVGSGQ
jgi:chromate transporter